MIPIILIFVGLAIYWSKFGWNLVLSPSPTLFISAFFVVMGLVVFMRTRSSKYY